MNQYLFLGALFILILLLLFLAVVGYFLLNGLFTVPWVRTTNKISKAMLEAGGFQPGEHVVDMGSGDGAIVFQAAKMGGTGTGMERLRLLVWSAKLIAKIKGVSNKTTFLEANVLTDPLPPADIVTCYLFPAVNRKLEVRLQEIYPPGTRLVSRDFTFGKFRLVKEIEFKSSRIKKSRIFVYEI